MALSKTRFFGVTEGFFNSLLAAVLRMPEILFVDRWMPPIALIDNARALSGANFLDQPTAQPPRNFRGQGVRGEVKDLGIIGLEDEDNHVVIETHIDFLPLPLIHTGLEPGQPIQHGTNVYGIVFSTGASNQMGKGVLPEGQGIFVSHCKIFRCCMHCPQGPGLYTHVSELVNPALPYRAVFQTNSVAAGIGTQYGTLAAQLDDVLFQFDILITYAFGNFGSQQAAAEAWAKNTVTVGGVKHRNDQNRLNDCWGCPVDGELLPAAATVGPAADGRIKPDLSHIYENVFTTDAFDLTPRNLYTNNFGGTSAATPITAGHFGLFFQMWHEGVFTGFGGGSDVFASRPHMTTAKAALINSAFQYPFSGLPPEPPAFPDDVTLFRMRQGWGMTDLAALYNLRSKIFIVNETELLSAVGSVQSYPLTVNAGEGALKATLVYADPAGTPSSSVHRVNDLTLKLTSPGGTVYWGNHGLTTGNWSQPGGSDDKKNTVENVFVQNPQPGSWLVEIVAIEINQDSHKETPGTDADFALIVSGVPCPNCAGAADWNMDGTLDQADVHDYIKSFGAGEPADFDRDGTTTSNDLFAFLGAYFDATLP